MLEPAKIIAVVGLPHGVSVAIEDPHLRSNDTFNLRFGAHEKRGHPTFPRKGSKALDKALEQLHPAGQVAVLGLRHSLTEGGRHRFRCQKVVVEIFE